MILAFQIQAPFFLFNVLLQWLTSLALTPVYANFYVSLIVL